MEVERLEDGLWRWTTAHPEWSPGAEWDAIVGCVYHETPDAVVLVDPLVPVESGEADRFLLALDRDVERRGMPVVVLTTCRWHERSAGQLAERYAARAIGPDEAASATLPVGVRPFAAPTAQEVVWWLAAGRSVVPGDTLLGDRDGGLHVCPASWIDSGGPVSALVEELHPLLELPVERVLVSHGEPIRAGGHAALARALAS